MLNDRNLLGYLSNGKIWVHHIFSRVHGKPKHIFLVVKAVVGLDSLNGRERVELHFPRGKNWCYLDDQTWVRYILSMADGGSESDLLNGKKCVNLVLSMVRGVPRSNLFDGMTQVKLHSPDNEK